MFALKIIQEIFLRYGNDISINEAKVLKVRKLLDMLSESNESADNEQLNWGEDRDKITLFQDNFSKRDLHYDFIKKFNFSEIGGPTLRQIDIQKKLSCIQREWRISTQKTLEDKNKLLQNIRSRAQKN